MQTRLIETRRYRRQLNTITALACGAVISVAYGSVAIFRHVVGR